MSAYVDLMSAYVLCQWTLRQRMSYVSGPYVSVCLMSVDLMSAYVLCQWTFCQCMSYVSGPYVGVCLMSVDLMSKCLMSVDLMSAYVLCQWTSCQRMSYVSGQSLLSPSNTLTLARTIFCCLPPSSKAISKQTDSD